MTIDHFQAFCEIENLCYAFPCLTLMRSGNRFKVEKVRFFEKESTIRLARTSD